MALISISGVLMAYALFSSRVFDLAPLARDAVVEHLADGVLVLDMRGRLMDFNPAAARTVPELGKASVGQPVAQLFAARPAVLRVFAEAAQEAREAGRLEEAPPRAWEVEVDGLAGSAEAPRSAPHVFNLLVTPISSGGGAPFGLAVVAQDVTQRVELLDDALRLATTDGLTGALTRRRFNELAEIEVARAIRHSVPVSLLLLDVDRLKLVNDTHGHAAGDAVLSSLAAACQGALRVGELIGRLGGDEFGVLLPLTGTDEASRVAERLRRAASDCLPPETAATWCATVSIGVVTAASQVGDTYSGLLDAADQALYVAKEGGRNRIAVAAKECSVLQAEDALPLALLSKPRSG
jgi:diguanylate cyclase (GGDEF)-like protein